MRRDLCTKFLYLGVEFAQSRLITVGQDAQASDQGLATRGDFSADATVYRVAPLVVDDHGLDVVGGELAILRQRDCVELGGGVLDGLLGGGLSGVELERVVKCGDLFGVSLLGLGRLQASLHGARRDLVVLDGIPQQALLDGVLFGVFLDSLDGGLLLAYQVV